ncbi:signal peptide peptidase 1-like [Gossypium raimondii]|uniref:signal peptide peptidase 1-like n=1 Tax=Gossypium raimondii TaxID=29730 RepID=UPI00063A984E|nr:signal peptide peptidase 1-like [Gossypium raimondii]
MKNTERLANLALAGLTLAPLVVKVDPNLNVILTTCLAVYVGCYRSVKPTPPSETMSKEHAMRFPFVGSAMLLSLFLLFKFLSKDLVKIVLGTLKIFMENYPMILLYLYCMATPCIS